MSVTRHTPLPPKRKRPKMGIDKGPQRIWPRHRRYVRDRDCSVSGCQGKAQFHHIRSAATAGTGITSHDWHGVGLCLLHHNELHGCGVETFADRHGVDLVELAETLARTSPDRKMWLAKLEWEQLLDNKALKPLFAPPAPRRRPLRTTWFPIDQRPALVPVIMVVGQGDRAIFEKRVR